MASSQSQSSALGDARLTACLPAMPSGVEANSGGSLARLMAAYKEDEEDEEHRKPHWEQLIYIGAAAAAAATVVGAADAGPINRAKKE